MKLRTASLFFSFAFLALPIHAQDPPTVQSLASELAALRARVAKLEGQIVAADLAGTYAFRGFQIELGGSATRPAQVASYLFSGTITLNADGTASFTATPDEGNSLSFTVPPSLSIFKGSEGGTGTTAWTYLNGSVTVEGLSPLSVGAGGRVLIGSSTSPTGGTTAIVILTRLQ